jgi:hypothetical protein
MFEKLNLFASLRALNLFGSSKNTAWRSCSIDSLPIRHTDAQTQASQLYRRLNEDIFQWIFNVIRHDNRHNN